MPAHLQHRPSPWLWPACWFLVLGILVGLFLVPQRWWERILPRGDLRPYELPPAAVRPLMVIELEIVPQRPEVAPVPDTDEIPEPPPVWRDAPWWDRAWEVRVVDGLTVPTGPARPDSIPWDLLAAWELPLDDVAALTMPDSVIAARIWEMALEERLDLSHLKDYFHSIGRARMYEDMKSREAAMFDEFIHEKVMVPNPDRDR